MTRAWMAIALVAAIWRPAEAHGSTVILDCDFDAKPLDQQIGTGGPGVGEPIELNDVPATVRSSPFPTPSLELADVWDYGAHHVRFEFLGGTQVVAGTVTIAMTLFFQDLNGFSVAIRERGSSVVDFTDIAFLGDGSVRFGDGDSAFGAVIAHYTIGTMIPLVLTFDLDARTYDVALDGTTIRDDEPYGTTTAGIGAILVGLEHDVDVAGTFFLDDLLVTATQVPTAVAPSSWGAAKAFFR